jgi:hypothetical protein
MALAPEGLRLGATAAQAPEAAPSGPPVAEPVAESDGPAAVGGAQP